MLLNTTRHYYTIAEAEALAKRCNEADDEWSYTVEIVGPDRATIRITEPDGYTVGHL